MPKVCVGNLAESVTSDDLRALFSKVGRVSGALVITDRITGRSRGFGFVDMIEIDDAVSASVYFLGAELEGRKLEIEPYLPRQVASEKYLDGPKRRGRPRRPATNGGA